MNVSQCALCQDIHFSPYITVGKRQIVKCTNCGFLFATDIPSAKEMEFHYSYKMEPDYLNKYKELAIKRGSLILKYVGKPTGKILDVGCGLGFFLGLAKKKGYEAFGVELSIEASEYARKEIGVNVFAGDISSHDVGNEVFDVVTIQHVLEHIPKPVEFLRHIRRLLKKDGTLVIVVPNANSLVGKLAGEKWLGFAVDEHVCHYTEDTLRFLLKRCGYEDKKVLMPQWDAGDLLWAARVHLQKINRSTSLQSGSNGGTTAQRSFIKTVLAQCFCPLAWLVSKCKAGQEIIALSVKTTD